MLSTISFSSVVENSALGESDLNGSFWRPHHKIDFGYILFGFGVLGVLSIAAASAVPRNSLPNCQLTVLGDVAVCETPDLSPPGLNVAEISVPTGILPVAYDTY